MASASPTPAPRAGTFFFHNPKAGGTAVGQVVADLFPPERRAPLIENNQHDHDRLGGDYSAFAGYDHYAGHYGFDVYRAVGAHLAPITNFRDPLTRLRSLYNYYRLQVDLPDDPATREVLHPVVVAQSVSFADFVTSEDPRVALHTQDFHVRQLTSSPWEPDGAADLAHATELVDRMPWFYVCEEPERSRRWGQDVFGDAFAEIPEVNVTVSARGDDDAVTTIDPGVRRAIQERNRLDGALHAHALDRLPEPGRGRWWRRSR